MTQRPTLHPPGKEGQLRGAGVGIILPKVSTNALAGMIEEVAAPPYDGKADLPHLADSLHMEIDDLFPIAETLQLLRFMELEEGDIELTPAGQRFTHAEVDARKKLFDDHLLAYLPLAARIRQVPDERPSHHAPAARFREELEDYMSAEYAERTLRAAIAWGRYGEVYAYSDDVQAFSLENPHRGPPTSEVFCRQAILPLDVATKRLEDHDLESTAGRAGGERLAPAGVSRTGRRSTDTWSLDGRSSHLARQRGE